MQVGGNSGIYNKMLKQARLEKYILPGLLIKSILWT